MASFSIKEKQTSNLIRMLNLNKPDSKETVDEPWKVLIYDDYCRDILAPLLRVGDLRKQGVTLHLSLNVDRQPVPDVPAVYFVLPTKENIQRICQDCANHLYDSYHLNFASSLPRNLLEELASSTLESGTVSQISKVFDQYVNFVSLEHDLFSLHQKGSYVEFNDPSISDKQAEANIEHTVDALFSTLVTLGVVPIIRCPKNGAAEVVATQLDSKLHDHLLSMGNLFSESATASFQRPVLVLLDRNVDIPVMLHHTWTYQALIHDLLDMKLNRVQVEVQELDENNNTKKEAKVYDLDSSDAFWTQNTSTPFQNIAVAVNTHLKEYKANLDELNKMSGGVDIDKYDESQLLGRTKDLGSFVNSIPQLREKKRIIDVHTNIATSLLNLIKAREIDSYFSVEEAILTRSLLDKKEMASLLAENSKGTKEDKLRLFLMYYIMANEAASSSDLDQFEDSLRKANIDLTPLKYLKKTKAFHDSLMNNNNIGGTTPSSSISSSVVGSTVRGLFQKVNVESFGLGGVLTDQLGTLFNAGVKALFPTNKELRVTRIVDAAMELKPDAEVDNYVYLDPKVQKKMRQSSIPRRNTPFKEAIVFVIGGGNYVEYQNVQEYAKKQPGKKIIYGSTEIATPHQFLSQLNTLGSKS